MKLRFYESCIMGKNRSVKFNYGRHTSTRILQYIHSNLWSPPIKSHGICKYFVIFINDYSRKVEVYFLKSKSKVFGWFKKWKTMVEKRTKNKLRHLEWIMGWSF